MRKLALGYPRFLSTMNNTGKYQMCTTLRASQKNWSMQYYKISGIKKDCIDIQQ